jgi:hypothetical protein
MTTDTNSTEAPYAWLQDRYPLAFPRERGAVRPLKVDIRLDLLAAHPELIQQAVKKMLAIWCGRPTYQAARTAATPARWISPSSSTRAHAPDTQLEAQGRRLSGNDQRRDTTRTLAHA